jgi:hypothetical protein
MNSAARTTAAPSRNVTNVENPSTPTDPASVENGPRSSSLTSIHSGMAAPMAPSPTRQVKTV